MLDTGRRWVGPTGDIVERQDPRTGERFLVLVLQEHYPRLPAVRSALDVGRGFLEQPLVDGVAPLREANSETGVCVYDARDMLVLSAMLDELGPAQAPGPRAAATLGTLATAILVEAAEAGELSGVFCHGDVSPWRILIGAGGEVGLLGYGIPEVEACRMRHTGADRPMVPSMAWAPPERLSGRPEDVRSDLFSLALVVAQVATGVPVLRGSPNEVYVQARAGVARELFGREPFTSLPTPLRRHLARMLGPSPSERPGPAAWADGWLAVLDAMAAGPDLGDTATIVARRWEERGRVGAARALVDPTSTRNSLVTLSRLLERRREPLPVLLPTDDEPLALSAAWTPTEPAQPEVSGAPRRVEAPERPIRRAAPEAPRSEPTLARPTLSTAPQRLDPAPTPTPDPRPTPAAIERRVADAATPGGPPGGLATPADAVPRRAAPASPLMPTREDAPPDATQGHAAAEIAPVDMDRPSRAAPPTSSAAPAGSGPGALPARGASPAAGASPPTPTAEPRSSRVAAPPPPAPPFAPPPSAAAEPRPTRAAPPTQPPPAATTVEPRPTRAAPPTPPPPAATTVEPRPTRAAAPAPAPTAPSSATTPLSGSAGEVPRRAVTRTPAGAPQPTPPRGVPLAPPPSVEPPPGEPALNAPPTSATEPRPTDPASARPTQPSPPPGTPSDTPRPPSDAPTSPRRFGGRPPPGRSPGETGS
jgi:hypothetical protein